MLVCFADGFFTWLVEEMANSLMSDVMEKVMNFTNVHEHNDA